jgi:hypothetical protein
MSLRRWLLAALSGAVVMFAWSTLSHTMLIRGIGFTRMPDEAAVVAQLRTSIHEEGLYFFPGIDWDAKPTAGENAAWQARFRAGNGILVYHPSSGDPVSPGKMLLQLLCDLLAAAIAAWLVARLPGPYWRRVVAVGAMGVFGCLGVSALFWNWYGFGHAFFAAHCFDKIVGWLVAGAAIARVAAPADPARASLPPGDVGCGGAL